MKLNERDQLIKQNEARRAEIQTVQNQATVLKNGNQAVHRECLKMAT